MALPDSAESYWRSQQALSASTVAIVLRAWRLSNGDPGRWSIALALVVAALTRSQAAAVLAAAAYVDAVLAEQSITVPPMAAVSAAPLVGVTGAGVALSALYEGLPTVLGLNAARLLRTSEESGRLQPAPVTEMPPEVFQQAMDATSSQLEASVQTLISDTGRAAESLEIAVRPGVGYVRMLNPPSCERCVVQAGKFFRWNTGFERHPRCDCRHIPARESTSEDLRVDPDRYFRSLSAQDQDKTFGKAGAQAIRDGASISQVVNSKRGMQTAQVYGRRLATSTEGVTKRGQAGRAFAARGRSAATTPRLMPESIYQIADDREDALRLLRMNGYIAA